MVEAAAADVALYGRLAPCGTIRTAFLKIEVPWELEVGGWRLAVFLHSLKACATYAHGPSHGVHGRVAQTFAALVPSNRHDSDPVAGHALRGQAAGAIARLCGHRHSYPGYRDRGERGHFQRRRGRLDRAASVSRAGSARASVRGILDESAFPDGSGRLSRLPRRVADVRGVGGVPPRGSSARGRRRSRTAARHAGHFGVLRPPGIPTGDGPRVRAAGRGVRTGRRDHPQPRSVDAAFQRRYRDRGASGASVGPHVPGRRRSSRRFPARRRDVPDVWSRGSRGRVVGPAGATGREPGQSLLSFLQRRGPGPPGREPVGDGRGSAPDGEARRDALPGRRTAPGPRAPCPSRTKSSARRNPCSSHWRVP